MIKKQNSYVKVSSCGYNKRMIIESSDRDNESSLYIILDIIDKLSVNNYIYALCSREHSELNKIQGVRSFYSMPSRRNQSKIWLDNIGDSYNSLINNKYCIFYICNKSFSFDEFCRLAEMGHPRKGFPQLSAIIAFADGEFPELEFAKNQSFNFVMALNKFIEKGFDIKKRFLL